MLAAVTFFPGVRAEDAAAKDQPAKAKCSCCSTDKDGKMTCGTGGDCCCKGTSSTPAEKIIPKSSYNRKS